jgi:hypothetical protein
MSIPMSRRKPAELEVLDRGAVQVPAMMWMEPVMIQADIMILPTTEHIGAGPAVLAATGSSSPWHAHNALPACLDRDDRLREAAVGGDIHGRGSGRCHTGCWFYCCSLWLRLRFDPFMAKVLNLSPQNHTWTTSMAEPFIGPMATGICFDKYSLMNCPIHFCSCHPVLHRNWPSPVIWIGRRRCHDWASWRCPSQLPAAPLLWFASSRLPSCLSCELPHGARMLLWSFYNELFAILPASSGGFDLMHSPRWASIKYT